jgi:hypothetical protein
VRPVHEALVSLRSTACVACLTVAVLCRDAPPASAGELAWQAPAGECPDPAGFAALGDEMSGGQVLDVAVRAQAWHAEDGWHVRVEARLDAQHVEREIQAPTCAEVAHAAALVVALLGKDASAPPADTPSRAPVAPTTRVPPPRPRPALVEARVDAGAATGTLPGVTPRLGLALEVHARRFRLELGGEWRFAGHASGAEGTSADFSLLAADVRGCFVPTAWRVCAGVMFGRLEAHGSGSSLDQTSTSLWLALAASLAYEWKLSPRFGILAEAELALPTERAVFVLEGVEVHTVAPLDARLGLGITATIF